MVPDTTLILLAGAFLGTALLEFGVLFAARRLRILAVPNSRSFHSQPTPTIGGVGFVVPVAVYLAALSLAGVGPATGLLVGGLLLAVVGLWDDIRDLSSAFRLLCHVLAVALGLYFLDPPLSLAVLLVVGFGLVWYVNLFNFMDGIDGIAGVQVLFYCVAVQVLTGGVPGWLGEFTWLLSSAMVGFLAFNWPPARIFMGDVGSGFLGLMLGFLALMLDQFDFLPLVGSLILLAGFWFDASYTLCVRMITRQKFTQGHRSHLYQKLAAKTGHGWTTAASGVYATVWLLPLAAASAKYPDWAVLWLALAVAPLLVAAVRLEAGRMDSGHE